MMKLSDYFGKTVTFTHRIVKEQHREYRQICTRQVRVKHLGANKGLCIGFRHLPETITDIHEDVFGTTLGTPVTTRTQRCLLVVTGPRTNPLRVSLIGVEIVD